MVMELEDVLKQLKAMQPTIEKIYYWGSTKFQSRFTFVQGYLEESIQILEKQLAKEKEKGGPVCGICESNRVEHKGGVCDPCWSRI